MFDKNVSSVAGSSRLILLLRSLCFLGLERFLDPDVLGGEATELVSLFLGLVGLLVALCVRGLHLSFFGWLF